jgi:hypothetical protein
MEPNPERIQLQGQQQPIQSGPSTNFNAGEQQRNPLDVISSIPGNVVEAFTGEKRKTEASQFFPDWRNNLPEFSLTKGPSLLKAIKVAATTATASPEETAKIVKEQYPNVNVLQDEKGNYFFESDIDKKIYAIPPGFGETDVPRAIIAGAMFAPAARAATTAGRIVGAGLTQLGIESAQAGAGGTFNAADIPIAAATQGAFEAFAARNAIKQSVGELLGGLLQKEKAAMPAQYVGAAGEMVSTVPANIAAEMGGALTPAQQIAAMPAPMAAEMAGALDAQARGARLGQYISPTGERMAAAPASMAAEAGGALGYPKGKFMAPTGELTPAVPSNIQAEMAGALAVPPQRFPSATGGITAEIPAGIRAEMGGALSRELPAPPQYIGPTGVPTSEIPAGMRAEMGGALSREVQPVSEVATSAAPNAAPLTAGERAAAGNLTLEELGGLIKKASSNSFGSTKAKEELATLIGENPQLRADFERIGIDATPDFFSDNQQIRKAIGLTRSETGSIAESEFLSTLKKATDKADELMASVDASKDISLVSENIRRKLVSTRQEMQTQAKKIYDDVNRLIPADTKVELQNVKTLLDNVKKELRGKGKSLHKEEKRLDEIISEGDVSYKALKREKDLVFKAIQKQESPYGSMVESELKDLYSAFSKDQIENVSRVAGEDAGQQLRAANFLWAKHRGLGNRIISIFGKDEQTGSVAALMQSAIKTGSKGDTVRISKLLKSIPQEEAALRKQVVATAINDLSLSKSGANEGNFSFSRFADTWGGIKRNSEVIKIVSKELGSEATSMLDSLYSVSRSIAGAEKNVLHTGKANQVLINVLNEQSGITRLLSTATGKAGAAGVGALFGGPAGAVVGSLIQNSISRGSKEGVKRAGDLFSDSAFQALIREIAQTGRASTRATNRVNISRAFNKFRELMPNRPLTVPPILPSASPQQESK